MGQKVNPVSNRLGIIRGWDSNWYGGKKYGDTLLEDSKIRKYLNARLAKASVSRVVIERTLKLITITVCTSRPGIIIGKGGQEVDKLKEEYNRIDTDTEFNKKTLLDGKYTGYLQVGANEGQGYTLTIGATTWEEVTLDQKDGQANSKFITKIDDKITEVSTLRSQLGAQQNKLEYTIKVDDNTAENMQSAESRIRDTDMADEMTRFSKESILQQAATSMLAQANQANQHIVKGRILRDWGSSFFVFEKREGKRYGVFGFLF